MPAGEMINMAAFSNAMKYNELFDKQFKQYKVSTFLLNNLRSRPGRVRLGGRVMEVPLETRGMASFGAQQELEPVSEPDNPGFGLGTVTIKTLTSRFQISLQAHLASQNDRHAWVSAKTRAMSSTVEMFAMNHSRLLHGTGTAALARVDTTIAAGPPIAITVDADQSSGADNTFGTRYIIKGMRLSASVSKTGLVCEKTTDLRVVSVDKANNIIYCDGEVGDLADADYLYLGSKSRTSKNRAPMGIMGYIDDGTKVPTVVGIDRTAAGNEYFQATVRTTVGSKDLESEFQLACDDVFDNHNGQTNLIGMAMGVWRRMGNDMRGDRRFVTAAETGRYKGGTRMLMWTGGDQGDVPIMRDRDFPSGTAYGFDWDTWYMGELLAPGWLQQFDEKSIFRWVEDLLAWEAIYAQMGECVCTVPGRQWVCEGITEYN